MVTPWPYKPIWQNEISEIEPATRFSYAGNLLSGYGDKSFFESIAWGTASSNPAVTQKYQ